MKRIFKCGSCGKTVHVDLNKGIPHASPKCCDKSMTYVSNAYA